MASLLSRRAVRAAVASAVSVLLLAVGITGSASAAPGQYPVPYSLVGGFFANPASIDPNTPPPGVNIWSCRPSAAHPEPVVLLHGLGGNQALNWSTMSPLLANNGYCVFSLTYGNQSWLPPIGGLKSMRDSARQVSAFVDQVLARTGATKVALVGHSEGSTVAADYLKNLGGAAKASRLVGFSPNYAGTTLYGLTLLAQHLPPLLNGVLITACTACQQYYPGSGFIAELNAGGTAAVDGVAYTNIQGAVEQIVRPDSSGRLQTSNATNVRTSDGCALDASDHISTVSSRRAGQIMLNALDPAHPRPLPCAFNPPFLS